mmetsp:Transcript_35495/g.78744  ORF Transcript_35495/g.78744 Transcript_35495/m.78744 type:complete len:267 (+) Transcript_35495:48-848(+)
MSKEGLETPQSPCLPGAVAAWLRKVFSSKYYHVSVIVLVLLELGFVITDVALIITYCEHEPHEVHIATEVLSWASIGILGIFVVENIIKLLALGPVYYSHLMHLLDAIIVVASFVLELALRHTAVQEIGGLLVAARLWRLFRVIHATQEVQENHEMKEAFEAMERELSLEQAKLKHALDHLVHHGIELPHFPWPRHPDQPPTQPITADIEQPAVKPLPPAAQTVQQSSQGPDPLGVGKGAASKQSSSSTEPQSSTAVPVQGQQAGS